ncbi:hypothetical protein [Pyrobaculum aerophilum]|uniref:Uncharacterized protein n=1 Tax=Pyrobaculum aerophilum TaxID=13773 RepID=A0A371QZI3_9CREN|nr:hypothetical protein [Pyrobaculum aerophilum]RFA96185.1 hypothetical protein CGL51_05845 [Pyrobaculum aerophilum]RFA98592.1 hypothetical protein CGL52_06635 [Pyrobaculum aerophilum]
MESVWLKKCQKDAFARAYPRLCAAAMVAALRECGEVVRHNYWVKIKPRPKVVAVIKEASKLAGSSKFISVRALVVEAVEAFLKELAIR